ncbi:estradiol 17 beta-dehydrogenase, putative [Talaromyces stipitatus ATCC 10500]|uniref:Estradiol 17 beta-dehydrogenase, putative n=1 Tax=Talaromyces stipitatus (strain ATCC 10500 / CBS 375.48 / QM 6759 / NRRL 1006) TaxID=441959 RepID=B8LW09_TALSN|nr:estradiol 17 beta-dehydrogenase, putative [Talaromyces stipitatus ATCC 10500]EED24375.1 estradiol 17 beta-dehydrogenase, putative [Talaromyces stipitatus ATCC 10500]
MASDKRKVLITGCSDGGLGSALAIAFHEAGFHVIATARNVSKMKQLEALGIETLTLDVLSDSSIAGCVRGGYFMPMADLSIAEARKCFDLNVWSYIAVSQAFLPLLLKSKGVIVNQTSLASVITFPFQGAYNAAKAAMAAFSDTMRRELEPFGVTVVDLKTGVVTSNFFQNQKEAVPTSLPEGSIYEPAKEEVEHVLRGKLVEGKGMPSDKWAKQVVQELMKPKPSSLIWRGTYSFMIRILSSLPHSWTNGFINKAGGLDVVEKWIRK